jgi:hypothetical protein
VVVVVAVVMVVGSACGCVSGGGGGERLHEADLRLRGVRGRDMLVGLYLHMNLGG